MKNQKAVTLVIFLFAAHFPLHAAPVWEWVQTAAGIDSDFGTGVAIDNTGGIYFSGYLSSGGKVGEQSVGSSSLFWSAITQNGSVSRVTTAASGPASQCSSSLAIAPDGSLIAHGIFYQTLALGPGFNAGTYQTGAFLSAMKPTLELLWSKAYGVETVVYSPPAVYSSADILVSASFRTVSFDGVSLGSSGATDVLALRTQANGTRKFMRSGGGSNYDYAGAAAFDANGNAFIGGGFTSSLLSFGAAIATNNAAGGYAGFVVKLDNNGVAQWSRSFGTNGMNAVFSIAPAPNGDIVAGGILNNQGSAYNDPQTTTFISLFERITSTGDRVWSRKIQGLKVQDLKIETTGNIVLLGVIAGTVQIDGRTFPSSGGTDIFVGKFDPSGALIWGKTAGGIFNETAGQLAIGPNGAVFVAGTIGGTAQFDSILVSGQGSSDAILAKLADPSASTLPEITTQPHSAVVSGGMNFELTTAATGALPLSFQWWFNGAPLAGQTSSSLMLTNVRSENAGSYFVVAKNSAGETQSEIANVSYTDAGSLQLSVHPSLTIFGTPGRTYRIDSAVETRSPAVWTSITNISLPTSPYVWQDTNAALGERRFYRVLLQP